MTDVEWARRAAFGLLGWRDVDVQVLPGTSESSSVFRVSYGRHTAVLKSYNDGEFQRARLLAGHGSPFAPIITESVSLRAIAFEDLGDLTLGNLLQESEYLERRALAVRYVELIGLAHEALSTLGRPAPAALDHGVDAQLGIIRLTKAAAEWRSALEKLDAVARLSRGQMPDADVREQAHEADMAALDWAQKLREARGSWIIGDSNPFNVMLGSRKESGEWRLIDVQIEAGIPDVDLMPLGGNPFNLTSQDAAEIALSRQVGPLEQLDWNTLNGWFSLTCLCDSLAGQVTGSRDASARHNMDYDQSDRLCLTVARDFLPRGHRFGHGWLPYVDWLVNTPVRLPA